jgi:hypothetical protein
VVIGLLLSPLIERWLAPFVQACLALGGAMNRLAPLERRLEALLARMPRPRARCRPSWAGFGS